MFFLYLRIKIKSSLWIQKANVTSQVLIFNSRADWNFQLTLNMRKQVFVTPQFHAEFVIKYIVN